MSEPRRPTPENRPRLIAITLDEGSTARQREHRARARGRDLRHPRRELVRGRRPRRRPLQAQPRHRRRSAVLTIGDEAGATVVTHMLSLTPLKRIMKDYFLVCDSYYQAIRTAPPSRIQAIDMGRRGLHDEGSRILIERLDGKITLDFDTARRLFTLICALHWKG